MLKDAQHYGGWEHRDVHNIYGFYVVRGRARRAQGLGNGHDSRLLVLTAPPLLSPSSTWQRQTGWCCALGAWSAPLF